MLWEHEPREMLWEHDPREMLWEHEPRAFLYLDGNTESMISISFRKKEEELVNFDYQSEILFVRAIITSTAGARFVFLPSYRTRFSTRQSARVFFRTVFLNTFSLFPQCQSLQTYYFICIPPKMSEVFFTYASFYFTMVFTFLEFLV